MDLDLLEARDFCTWHVPVRGAMRVPGIIYADSDLVSAMDAKVLEQISNVASLPGIVKGAFAMPDAHWGYGFPVGGVAAFDPDEGGVVSAGGVGFDISCGVRMLHTGLDRGILEANKRALAERLFQDIPAGVGSTGSIRLNMKTMDAMLAGGARWAVEQGYGRPEDLEHIEENGCMAGADPGEVSLKAKQRQKDEMGTLGSGNHYLEVQYVTDIYDEEAARAFQLTPGAVVISIHCGSRGLGHQIGTEFLKRMVTDAPGYGLKLPDRELASAPINSLLGESYLGAMRAGINCALANRQIITALVRKSFSRVISDADLVLFYDVSHNTCKVESHAVGGRMRRLFVHRKGATRAFGPGHPELPQYLRSAGQPVLIGGTMGTCSYVMAGAAGGEDLAFSSACHGAGRAMSRRAATRNWKGREVVDSLEQRGILVRSPSLRGVAEEAPGAYKDVVEVVEAAQRAGLARKVARMEPMVCIKG